MITKMICHFNCLNDAVSLETGSLSWIVTIMFSALGLLIVELLKSNIMTRVKNIISGAALVWRMVYAKQ